MVKDHPMYPISFEETPNLSRTSLSLLKHDALSAVVYSSGTSGLEARLAKLPAFRLIQEDRISIDVLPSWINNTATTEEKLEFLLSNSSKPDKLVWDRVLSPKNWSLWEDLLSKVNSPLGAN